MNGLLRHTSNIHIGTNRGRNRSYLGIIADNIKAGFVFVANGFTKLGNAAIGLIRSVKL